MTRRRLLFLIELTLFTTALATSLGLLAHAASVGHAQWADPAMVGVGTALSLLVPATLAALLRAAWLGTPPLLRAVRGRVHEWRQWRGIQRVDAAPVRDTMAVRPRAAHAAPPAHDVEAGLWRPRTVGGGRSRRHEGRHNKRTTLLVVAPRPELLALPLHEVVALPDNKLMAWCGECETRAKKAALGPVAS